MWSSGKERPQKRQRRDEIEMSKNLKVSSSALTSLPYDIVLNCLARVSRSDHASLSLVSKPHRDLLHFPELYDVRSRMGLTEKCIFLCLSIPSDPFVRWFAFTRKALNNPGRLVPIRPHLYQPSEVSAVVAHGWGIYIIGGVIGGRRSSRVFFLDGRTHTWTNLPSMWEARASAAAGVVDGKIYVLGGCEEGKARIYGEVFDPETQTWDALPMPGLDEKCLRFPMVYESAVVMTMEEKKKVLALSGTAEGLMYNPSEGILKRGNFDLCGKRRGWQVIENVIYSCETGGRILWCEATEMERRTNKGMKWGEVMGLEDLRKTLCASKLVSYGWGVSDHWEFFEWERAREGLLKAHVDDVYPGHKLSSSGPNLLLFWDVLGPHKLEIFCAEISLQRRKETGQIWGNLVWSEAVMTLDPPVMTLKPSHHQRCKVLYSLSLDL
uniref:Putative F-box/kelch-repeat protein n=1 Tax=Noccaea caerulescens TaxID=107243 RepID=A0A1J3JUS8_NOCCA